MTRADPGNIQRRNRRRWLARIGLMLSELHSPPPTLAEVKSLAGLVRVGAELDKRLRERKL